MLRTRVIPALLLRNESLVKTQQFKKYTYIGDPCNTVRIFNECEVDELMFLDITASKDGREPNYDLLADIASECFMPVSYGGGVRSVEHARKILSIGIEKVCINSAALDDLSIVTAIANEFGSQALIASIDYKKNLFGKAVVVRGSNQKRTGKSVLAWAKDLEAAGAGEILLTCVDNEGTWRGFDLCMIKEVSNSVSIPVIAHGGAGSISDIDEAVNFGKASAVALGSMVVFQKKGMGVLVSFPEERLLNQSIE